MGVIRRAAIIFVLAISVVQSSVFAGTHPIETVRVMSGDFISVQLQSDVGSRNSNEGDTFAVQTVEDYYSRGKLVLPKGSPGYGIVTHVKRAGLWHSGGEFTFTVRRLIAPDGTTINTEVNGATADADKGSEQNGNYAGQYAMWGLIGVFTKRGNDIFLKAGTIFHVAVSDTTTAPVVAYGTLPASLNPALLTIKPTLGHSQYGP